MQQEKLCFIRKVSIMRSLILGVVATLWQTSMAESKDLWFEGPPKERPEGYGDNEIVWLGSVPYEKPSSYAEIQGNGYNLPKDPFNKPNWPGNNN